MVKWFKVEIDYNCVYCKETIKNFKEDGDMILRIKPDKNAFGNITHYHVGQIVD